MIIHIEYAVGSDPTVDQQSRASTPLFHHCDHYYMTNNHIFFQNNAYVFMALIYLMNDEERVIIGGKWAKEIIILVIILKYSTWLLLKLSFTFICGRWEFKEEFERCR